MKPPFAILSMIRLCWAGAKKQPFFLQTMFARASLDVF
jgi:hypothetical protein